MGKTVGDNLKAYRLKSNLTLAQAGKLLNISAPGLLKYERNQVHPSLEKLTEIAKIYQTTLDDLLETDKSSEIKFTNFKCMPRTSEINKNKIKNIISNKIDSYFEVLSLSDIKLQNKFGIHIINSLEGAESLATKLRIFFTLPIDNPISDLVYLLESNGIMIITIPKNEITKGFVGFYENINNIPVIVVLEEDNGYDQRFNIAKFLGELLIQAPQNKDAITTRFAECLLIPKHALINEFGSFRSRIDFKEIEIFSSLYKVSYKNIIKRLQMCEIITPSNAKYTNIYINKNHIKEQIYLEQARNYKKLVYRLYAQGQIKNIDKYI